FGLDQINALLAMYLMVAPCGAMYSLDAWRRRVGCAHQGCGEKVSNDKRESMVASWWAQTTLRSTSANIATRLIQVHLCVLYLFAGLSKLQGQAWWDGTAIWNAVANLEY